MSVGYIAAAKELTPESYAPLLVAEITFGQVLYVLAATNASPIAITTNGPHGLDDDDVVSITGAGGNTAANGTWIVTVTGASTLTLNSSAGNGTYISGGMLSIGDVLRLASHFLTATADGGGGFSYLGVDYLPRILNTNQAITQAMSDQGIDFTPSVSLQIADPDNVIFQFEMNEGFKGAIMVIRFLMWNAGNQSDADFSIDSTIRFVGMCEQASANETAVTVRGVSKMNMSNTKMPPIPLQQTCPWNFPSTPAQRQDGADNFDSPYYNCGYSPDATGANAVGNYLSTGTLPSAITATATTIPAIAISGAGFTLPYPIIIDDEVVIVNSTGTTWGVTRGAQGTIGVTHSSGAPVVVPYAVCNQTRQNCIRNLGNVSDTTLSPDGDIAHDQSGRHTGRGGMIQYVPVTTLVARNYISGNWEQIINTSNQAKYGQLMPLPYGTTWVSAMVMNTNNDGNMTNMEVLLGVGQINWVYQVVVNGEVIPHANNDQVMPQIPGQLVGNPNTGGYWLAVNNGQRDGAPNILSPWNGQGDPYGGLAALVIVVPQAWAPQGSIPSVQVWIDGTVVNVYSDPTTSTPQFTDNPAWVMLDLLFWAGWRATDIDIQSFIDAAAIFGTQIDFTNQAGSVVNTYPNPRSMDGLVSTSGTAVTFVSGLDFLTCAAGDLIAIGAASTAGSNVYTIATVNSLTSITLTTSAGTQTNVIYLRNCTSTGAGVIKYAMFAVSMTLGQRTSAADVMRGLRNNCKSIIVPNYDSGLLHLFMKGTLAAQQPSLAQLNGQTATNDTTAYESVLLDGTAADGYSAYTFDESNICVKQGTENTTRELAFEFLPRSIADSPDDISITFEDLENQYNADGLTVIDTEDTGRLNGQQIIGTLPIYGVNSFDRGQRAIATWLAEILRGNPRDAITGATIGDTGGTYTIAFETSFRAIHLKLGDIIIISNQQRSLTEFPFRIKSIQPGSDSARIQIQASWHNDGWYLTDYGQANAPLFRNPQGFNIRSPYAMCPGLETPQPGDSMFLPTDESFQLGQVYLIAADNTAIATLEVTTTLPVDSALSSPQPPLVVLQATTASTGGSIPGGPTYYVGISAKNVSGSGYNPSFMSSVIAVVTVPGGTNTNTISVDIAFWDTVAAGYVVFGGTAPNRFSYQTDADFTPGSGPSSITLTAWNVANWGAPDQMFDHPRVYSKRGIHLGDCGLDVLSVTSTTITVVAPGGGGFPANQFAGYDISLMGLSQGLGLMTPSPANIPIFNAKIASHTSDTFTLATGLDGNVPDPTTVPRGGGIYGLQLNDVVVIRSLPTAGTDSGGNYIEDANWANNDNVLLAPIAVTGCTGANPGVITTAVAHGYSSGDYVFLQNMTGMSNFPILAVITVLTTYTFSIGVDTTTWGTYSGTGGVAQQQQRGLTPGAEVGNIVRCISGTGRGQTATIASNTATRIYINGSWPGATPDSTTRYIVESATWDEQQDGASVQNTSYTQVQTLLAQTNNYDDIGAVVMLCSETPTDVESLAANSPVRDLFIMGNPGLVAFTGSLAVSIQGTLAIGSNQAPLAQFNAAVTIEAATLVVKNAPTGAGATVNVNCGGTLMFTATIAAGTTSYSLTSVQIAAVAQFPALTNVTVDITAVGTTFPGSDLTVELFY